MDIHKRLKLVVKYLIGQGIAENQEKLGGKLGYRNKASFSHILNDRKPLPSDFIDRLVELDVRVNKVWIETGQGSMINNSSYIVSEPQMEYGKREDSDSKWLKHNIDRLIEDNGRNSKSIEKMVETADRNSQTLAKLVDILYSNGIVISDQTQKGGTYGGQNTQDDTAHNDNAAKAG